MTTKHSGRTGALLAALRDRKWHSTRELAGHIGHTFGHAKWRLLRAGYPIVRERHPGSATQFRYRLLHPAEARARELLSKRRAREPLRITPSSKGTKRNKRRTNQRQPTTTGKP